LFLQSTKSIVSTFENMRRTQCTYSLIIYIKLILSEISMWKRKGRIYTKYNQYSILFVCSLFKLVTNFSNWFSTSLSKSLRTLNQKKKSVIIMIIIIIIIQQDFIYNSNSYRWETNVILSIWSPGGGGFEGVLIPTASSAMEETKRNYNFMATEKWDGIHNTFCILCLSNIATICDIKNGKHNFEIRFSE
jgi:hypothetical protein